MLAAERGHVDLVGLLMQNKARDEITNKAGLPAIHVDTWNNKHTVLNTLLKTKLDVNCVDEFERSQLILAAQKRDMNIASFLLQNDALIDISDDGGRTALHIAAICNDCSMLKMLLMAHADVIAVDRQGYTPVMLTAPKWHQDVSGLFIQNNAFVEEISHKNGRAAIHLATINNHVAVTSTLLEAKVDVNCIDIFGQTPLMLAIQEGHMNL